MHQDNADLTSSRQWNQVWEKVDSPELVDLSRSFDRCLSKELSNHLMYSNNSSRKAFEVGCAPGKWLAYICRKYGYAPHGIDYSDIGILKTYETFKLSKVTEPRLVLGDFRELKSKEKFDLVYSLGFIEHFKDPEEIFHLHVNLVKPGGLVIIGIPNFQGINKIIQQYLNPEVLEDHNLCIMNRDWLISRAHMEGLTHVSTKYIGSYEPALPVPPHQERYKSKRYLPFRVATKLALHARSIELTDVINHPAFSSYLLSVYQA